MHVIAARAFLVERFHVVWASADQIKGLGWQRFKGFAAASLNRDPPLASRIDAVRVEPQFRAVIAAEVEYPSAGIRRHIHTAQPRAVGFASVRGIRQTAIHSRDGHTEIGAVGETRVTAEVVHRVAAAGIIGFEDHTTATFHRRVERGAAFRERIAGEVTDTKGADRICSVQLQRSGRIECEDDRLAVGIKRSADNVDRNRTTGDGEVEWIGTGRLNDLVKCDRGAIQRGAACGGHCARRRDVLNHMQSRGAAGGRAEVVLRDHIECRAIIPRIVQRTNRDGVTIGAADRRAVLVPLDGQVGRAGDVRGERHDAALGFGDVGGLAGRNVGRYFVRREERSLDRRAAIGRVAGAG